MITIVPKLTRAEPSSRDHSASAVCAQAQARSDESHQSIRWRHAICVRVRESVAERAGRIHLGGSAGLLLRCFKALGCLERDWLHDDGRAILGQMRPSSLPQV